MISAIVRLAVDLGIEAHETWLFYVAEEAFYCTPPRPWLKAVNFSQRRIYFFNMNTGVQTWEHPRADFYRLAVSRARLRLGKTELGALV